MNGLRILIGYSMRSGSTLLQHILDQHSKLQSFSDVSSFGLLAKMAMGWQIPGNFCLKPMDMLFLGRHIPFSHHFNKFLWIARDPRDSYLSTMESGYRVFVWQRGPKEHGIDVGVLTRWKQIYQHYFRHPDRWHLVRYEDLVRNPAHVIRSLLTYLELPFEQLLPFKQFKLRNGGDYKICHSSTVSTKSLQRFRRELSPAQIQVFQTYLYNELRALGYEA